MQTVVIVIHLMVVTAMIGVVLLQRSEGGGLGMGGGGGGFLTSRGTANVLTRTTAVLALIFFGTSLLLSVLAGIDRKPRSILQGPAPASEPANSGAPAPLGDGRGVLDQLRQMGQQPAPGGPAPSSPPQPQVPQSQ
ncbi:MAG TPA: preprotein translocase subunit SecG [Xanthobacteraceae bacterium]|nr:preprotein translocase subunit SecG [Xanthobacteraceae bacterium]